MKKRELIIGIIALVSFKRRRCAEEKENTGLAWIDSRIYKDHPCPKINSYKDVVFSDSVEEDTKTKKEQKEKKCITYIKDISHENKKTGRTDETFVIRETTESKTKENTILSYFYKEAKKDEEKESPEMEKKVKNEKRILVVPYSIYEREVIVRRIEKARRWRDNPKKKKKIDEALEFIRRTISMVICKSYTDSLSKVEMEEGKKMEIFSNLMREKGVTEKMIENILSNDSYAYKLVQEADKYNIKNHSENEEKCSTYETFPPYLEIIANEIIEIDFNMEKIVIGVMEKNKKEGMDMEVEKRSKDSLIEEYIKKEENYIEKANLQTVFKHIYEFVERFQYTFPRKYSSGLGYTLCWLTFLNYPFDFMKIAISEKKEDRMMQALIEKRNIHALCTIHETVDLIRKYISLLAEYDEIWVNPAVLVIETISSTETGLSFSEKVESSITYRSDKDMKIYRKDITFTEEVLEAFKSAKRSEDIDRIPEISKKIVRCP